VAICPPGYPQKTYEIDVAIERSEGIGLEVLLSYRKKRFRRISYGEMSIWEAPREFFARRSWNQPMHGSIVQ
jgi:hypothetical protein